MKNPDVEFCAYAIPHPSEPKMNVRIQTFGTLQQTIAVAEVLTDALLDSTTAVEALEKGLRDLQELCDVVTDQFVVAREKFMAK
jgi:DNA-directed RNA polymerase I and III subunit RPAC2